MAKTVSGVKRFTDQQKLKTMLNAHLKHQKKAA